ncbi:MAG: LysM peptidoglycan-binding domain-containing protein [Proteobacteria bacterium]|nr:LysM peptidoglycan-binding domain-containing protein [Pseudomonadota bacterium]
MTRHLPLALLFALCCAPALAEDADQPLGLSYSATLQSTPALLASDDADASTATAPTAPTDLASPTAAALPVVELTAPPAPAAAIDLTAQADDLFARIRTGFAMPNLSSDLVLHHQQWYMNRPDYLRRMVERSSRYLHHIVEEIEKRGMPTELALLPMVESAYNPMAYSRSHASGLWQFIPSTGKNFNLEQNWWIDERRDIVASTAAALDYLQTIYEMHGDWQLALASYNWGEGAVGRAIAKNRAKGLPTDYPSLTMPNETKNYVPKLQALKNIFGSPRLLAEIGLEPIPNRPYFGTVTLTPRIDVKVAARLAEMPVDEFVALNPAHNRPVIGAETPLVLPAGKVETFMSNLESHQSSDQPLSTWQTYTLRNGERLEQVAPRFGMTVANLKEVNGIKGRIKVKPGITLLVPARDGEAAESPAPAVPRLPAADPEPPAAGKTHTVRAGETLYAVARRYGTSVAELRRLNQLRSDRLSAGMRLTVAARAPDATPVRVTAAPAASDKGSATAAKGKAAGKPRVARYKVRRGDTLASIARQFNVDTDDLMRWNRVSPKKLQPGQVLTIELARNDD